MFGVNSEQAVLFSTICRVSNQYQTIGDKYYNGISVKQEYLLSIIEYYSKDKPPTLNNLSVIIGSSHQNVKQIVSKLVKKGYLTIEKDIDDKRKRRVYFTEKYKKDKPEFDKRRTLFLKQVFKGISDDEIEYTMSVIKKIISNQSKMLGNEMYMKQIFAKINSDMLENPIIRDNNLK